MKNKIKISVIICTYNRENYLCNAIKSLLSQTINKNLFEIIIVDNNSTDHTKRIVNSYQKKNKSPRIIYLNEKKQGAGSARNTGIKFSHGHYLAFLDDDALADKNWLKYALYLFKKIKPEPIAVGGAIFPIYEQSKPSWFNDKYEEDYKGGVERRLKDTEVFSGSNMILQKKILEKYGGFDTVVDIKNDKLSVGEDTAIFEKIRKNRNKHFFSFYYSPRLVVWHLIPSYKTTIIYRLKRSFAGGQSLYIRNNYMPMLIKLKLLVKYLSILIIFPIMFLWNMLLIKDFRILLIDTLSPLFYASGFILAFLKIKMSLQHRR